MPANASQDNRGNRSYTWAGHSYVSVTTILSNSIPKYLVPWASKLVAERAYDERSVWQEMARESALGFLKAAPEQVRESSANLGKDIHAATEAHVLGKPMPEWTPDIAPSMRQFERFLLERDPEYMATEATVYHRTHGWAGTGDAWLTLRKGKMSGVPLIADTKTGKSVYMEVALQLAAYRHGEFVGLPDGSEQPLPAVEGGIVLHLRPSEYRVVPIECGDDMYRVFRHCQQVARFVLDTGKTVIGEAI